MARGSGQSGDAGEPLGRYRLANKLFEGALGDLWLGRVAEGDDEGSAVLARRVPLRPDVSDDASRGLVEAARQAQQLRGAGLLPVRDVHRTEREIVIVSDAAEGETLRGLLWRAGLKRQPIPPSVALRLAFDLAAAIGVLRKARPHGERDQVGVGADQVWISVDGATLFVEPWVAGFAVAREPWAKDPKWACYRAPETLRTSSKLDERADVFAVAVLLWEMLRNRPLFGGAKFEAVERSIVQGSIGRVDSLRPPGAEPLSKALADVVGRALERDPILRPRSLEAFVRELKSAADAVAERDAVAAYVERTAADSLKKQRAHSADEGFHEAETIEVAVPLSSGSAPDAAPGSAPSSGDAKADGVPNFGELFGAPTDAPDDEAPASKRRPPPPPVRKPRDPAAEPAADDESTAAIAEQLATSTPAPASGSRSSEPDATGVGDRTAPLRQAGDGPSGPEQADLAQAGSKDEATAGEDVDDDGAAGIVAAGEEPPSVPPTGAREADDDTAERSRGRDGATTGAAALDEEVEGARQDRPAEEGKSPGLKVVVLLAALAAVAVLAWKLGPWSSTAPQGAPTTAVASAAAPPVETATATDEAGRGPDSAAEAAADAAAHADAEEPADGAAPDADAAATSTSSEEAPAQKPKAGPGGGSRRPKGRYMPGSL